MDMNPSPTEIADSTHVFHCVPKYIHLKNIFQKTLFVSINVNCFHGIIHKLFCCVRECTHI
jgi:hypothetical protein